MGFSDDNGRQSALCLKQIIIPTPHHSSLMGQMLFLTSNKQCKNTEDNIPYTLKQTLKTELMLKLHWTWISCRWQASSWHCRLSIRTSDQNHRWCQCPSHCTSFWSSPVCTQFEQQINDTYFVFISIRPSKQTTNLKINCWQTLHIIYHFLTTNNTKTEE